MVTRIEQRSPTTPAEGRRAGRPKADFLPSFLRKNRSRILADWSRRINRFPLSPELGFGRSTTGVPLDTIFRQLVRLVEADAAGNTEAILSRQQALAVQDAGAEANLLQDYLQIFFICSESLRHRVKEEPAFIKAPAAAREAALRRLDTAFSILIHREIQAFAENCNRLLRQSDLEAALSRATLSEGSPARARTA